MDLVQSVVRQMQTDEILDDEFSNVAHVVHLQLLWLLLCSLRLDMATMICISSNWNFFLRRKTEKDENKKEKKN